MATFLELQDTTLVTIFHMTRGMHGAHGEPLVRKKVASFPMITLIAMAAATVGDQTIDVSIGLEDWLKLSRIDFQTDDALSTQTQQPWSA